MGTRRFNVIENSFSSSSMPLGPSWAFRPGSRADHVHRGRHGINRRYHNIHLENECMPVGQSHANDEQRSWRETSARQTKSAPRGADKSSWSSFQNSSDNGNGFHSVREQEFTTSTHPGRAPVRMEQGDWSMQRDTLPRQRQEYFEETIDNRMPLHQESVRYHETPYKSTRQNFVQTQERTAEPSTRYRSEREIHSRSGTPRFTQDDHDAWNPVQVAKYSEPVGMNGGGSSRQTNYSVYRTGGRSEPVGQYSVESPSDYWEEQWDRRLENGEPRLATESTRRRYSESNQRTPRYESSERPHHENSWHSVQTTTQSRNNPASFDRGMSYHTTSTSSLNDGTRNHGTWDNTGHGGGGGYSYSKSSSTSFGPGGTWQGRSDGQRYGRQNQGSYTTYHQESSDSPNIWQNSNGRRQLGSRSRSRTAYSEDFPSNFRPRRAKSAERMLDYDTTDGLRHMSISDTKRGADDQEFLGKLQKELEIQRRNWQPEIDKLLTSTIVSDEYSHSNNRSATPFEVGKNSYVDTNSSTPTFKAYVDIKEFSPDSVKINFDRYTNKVVVEASHFDAQGTVGETFTQKIPLPKYADDTKLVARVNSSGVLRIEVPLVYYFPEEVKANKTRAFVYDAHRSSADGPEVVEIIVKPGSDFSAQDLRTEVVDGKLLVWGKRGRERKVIQNYVLPPTANIKGIRERIGTDGCLTIRIPVT